MHHPHAAALLPASCCPSFQATSSTCAAGAPHQPNQPPPLALQHCVRDLVTGLDRGSDERLPGVRLGGYFRASDAAGAYEARSTVATVVHPQFVAGLSAVTSNLLDNDVALLLLDSASSMPVLPLIGARGEPPVGAVAGAACLAARFRCRAGARLLSCPPRALPLRGLMQ